MDALRGPLRKHMWRNSNGRAYECQKLNALPHLVSRNVLRCRLVVVGQDPVERTLVEGVSNVEPEMTVHERAQHEQRKWLTYREISVLSSTQIGAHDEPCDALENLSLPWI